MLRKHAKNNVKLPVIRLFQFKPNGDACVIKDLVMLVYDV